MMTSASSNMSLQNSKRNESLPISSAWKPKEGRVDVLHVFEQTLPKKPILSKFGQVNQPSLGDLASKMQDKKTWKLGKIINSDSGEEEEDVYNRSNEPFSIMQKSMPKDPYGRFKKVKR